VQHLKGEWEVGVAGRELQGVAGRVFGFLGLFAVGWHV
jgi:hypothetical protein